MGDTAHNMEEEFIKSEDPETLKLIDKWYKRQFGDNLKEIERIDHFGDKRSHDLQHSGVDVILHLSWQYGIESFNKTICIDEKIRYPNKKTGKDYTDVLLEIWSNYEKKKPGWIFKSGPDYVLYCFQKSRRLYLIPGILLLRWAQLNWSYVMRCKTLPVPNISTTTDETWNSINSAIPVDVLLEGIVEIMEGTF